MKLILDDRNEFKVILLNQETSIADFAKIIRGRSGIVKSVIGIGAGVTYPSWTYLENGKAKSVNTLMRGLIDLGYEIEIRKSK